MIMGTVRWFNHAKGYGFIKPDDPALDIFVHISSVQRSMTGPLHDGQRLSFEIGRDQRTGRIAAVNLQNA